MSAVPMSRVGARARSQKRSRAKAALLDRTIAFCIIVGLTYLCSSLAGQVMVEQARLESIRATDRALEARKVVGEIENRLNEMTNLNSVDEWARAHNFLSIAEQQQPASVKVGRADMATGAEPVSRGSAVDGKPR